MDRRSLITLALSVIAPILFLTFVRCDRVPSFCGFEVPAFLFIFPYAMLSIIPIRGTEALFYTLAAIQFPAYSGVWYLARKRTRLKGTAWLLVGLHLVVAVAAVIIVASSVH